MPELLHRFDINYPQDGCDRHDDDDDNDDGDDDDDNRHRKIITIVPNSFATLSLKVSGARSSQSLL